MPHIIASYTLAQFLLDDGKGSPMAGIGEFSYLNAETQRRLSMSSWETISEICAYYFANRQTSERIVEFSLTHCGNESVRGTIFVWHEKSGEIVGGQARGIPYVLPEFRGRKIGREIILYAFENYLKTIDDKNICFSESGLASRISAHRFAVSEAMRLKQKIPNDIAMKYRGMNILRSPTNQID